jgi:DNA excision repair protein ERCC-2
VVVVPKVLGSICAQAKLDAGVYTLHDLRVLCRKEDKHWCPYYLARHMIAFANVVVYNYQYMLDPKVEKAVPLSRSRQPVVASTWLS